MAGRSEALTIWSESTYGWCTASAFGQRQENPLRPYNIQWTNIIRILNFLTGGIKLPRRRVKSKSQFPCRFYFSVNWNFIHQSLWTAVHVVTNAQLKICYDSPIKASNTPIESCCDFLLFSVLSPLISRLIQEKFRWKYRSSILKI